MKVKGELYALCREFVDARIGELNRAIQSARDSANEDTKSSAGDKFETTREMLQQEIALNLGFLAEAERMRTDLDRIAPGELHDQARPGSLVGTTMGRFYLSVSAGKLLAGGAEYFAVSQQSPLGQALKGKKAGDEFEFRGAKQRVNSVE